MEFMHADLQSRFVSYQFIGYDRDGKIFLKNKLRFFNPKAGMSWQINEKQQFCLSVAVAHKEPVRDDYVNSSPDSRPKAEALTDLEAGYRFSLKKFFLSANVYHMAYTDQLILTGEINDVGEYTRQNVADSYRQGIEFEGGWSVSEKVKLSANATFSKIKSNISKNSSTTTTIIRSKEMITTTQTFHFHPHSSARELSIGHR
ncbi:MAG: TonB-dependent receptor [Bacteroidetes bacterium]|nr:TonB-dependent receptor [Bacteroidota bacterium]